ncbi:MAG: S-methyl-5-thioribose-1-phosphate isomerase [Acidobacteria bacterium]|nr:S-methyl-5-thioribose-1-phosphate isomerase [Acidobacteriota bacterium]
MIKTIEWTEAGVVMIDQRSLPSDELYHVCRTHEEVAEAIRTMVIRGAPAIGVAAAMGIALGVQNLATAPPADMDLAFDLICRTLATTRPTAVNLFWAIDRMKRVFQRQRSKSIHEVAQLLRAEALAICQEDIAANRQMGAHGQILIPDGAHVLTHCNAGALATAGYGTALGVLRAAVSAGKRLLVYVDETRPFLQGARLTAWELMKDNIPVRLITDNMAGHFMKKGEIDHVIVGADRIAANGDVANKIGTYMVAVLAQAHRLPFYVAAPISTVDLSISNGDQIPIEERQPAEVTDFRGVRVAPYNVAVANPAFDVTPAAYIHAIITEQEIAWPPFEKSLPVLAGAAGGQLTKGGRHN